MKTILILLTFVFMSISLFAQEKNNTEPCTFEVSTTISTSDFDKLMAFYTCEIKSFSFELYDRWGQSIYSTNKLGKYLDFNLYEKVTVKRTESYRYKTGTYFWKAKYQVVENNTLTEKQSTGSLLLIAPQ
ncbi:MAG: gliding motility-associated C-terminal domain-containing protein [Bacteroidia bacterium]|nr:gliding motility-associated C-terminal domain-containing protein [Bacteroidia bacterium]